MPYAYPVGDIFVSADWHNHCCERNPPSSEPGTDVTDLKTSNSGAMGRYVRVTLDDGRTTRSLHMSRVDVSLNQRVSSSTTLGLSGASGNGSDYYYGSHLHQTLWPGCAFCNPTIDFELYVGSTPAPSKEDKVIFYHREDAKAKASGGRSLTAGKAFWLNTSASASDSAASNIVGGIGDYSITCHVYADGTPGDTVQVKLAWDDTNSSGAHSYHYNEVIEIPATGHARRSFEFKRGVAKGYAVYMNVEAGDQNNDVVKVVRADTDAYLFVSA